MYGFCLTYKNLLISYLQATFTRLCHTLLQEGNQSHRLRLGGRGVGTPMMGAEVILERGGEEEETAGLGSQANRIQFSSGDGPFVVLGVFAKGQKRIFMISPEGVCHLFRGHHLDRVLPAPPHPNVGRLLPACCPTCSRKNP